MVGRPSVTSGCGRGEVGGAGLQGVWLPDCSLFDLHSQVGLVAASHSEFRVSCSVSMPGMHGVLRDRCLSWVLGVSGLGSEPDRELGLVGASPIQA